VGFSFNPYVWHEAIDPKAGVIRLVFGLGTRAVDRSDDDYTRVVALNAPERRPEHSFDQVRQYAQRRVDYLDLEANQLVSGHFLDLAGDTADMPIDLFASEDRGQPRSRGPAQRVLTFDRLLSRTPFVADMRDMLRILHTAYDYPVDVEFTANFTKAGAYRINLVQCRPLQVQGAEAAAIPEITVAPGQRIIEARSAVVGESRICKVERFIYVRPAAYGKLPVQQRYEVARLIGAINRTSPEHPEGVLMVIGPGRWGTSSPSLGIPVSFTDINRAEILCEIVTMHEDLVPDVSLGTHFLNELVELNMLYLALFPSQSGNYLNEDFFESSLSRLTELVPGSEKWADTVRVIDAPRDPDGTPDISLAADAMTQRVICFVGEPAAAQ
jgi:hypothetical protein